MKKTNKRHFEQKEINIKSKQALSVHLYGDSLLW